MFGVDKCDMLDLGYYPHDADMNTNILAGSTGNFKVHASVNGEEVREVTFAGTSGSALVIPKTATSHLNEDSIIEFYITDPSGNIVSKTVSGIVYSYFFLKTFINNL